MISSENPFDSCNAILESILKEDDSNKRLIKYYDYIHKYNSIATSKSSSTNQKEKYDFIIFTIVPVEFMTLTKLLNIDIDRKPDYDVNGWWFYKVNIERNDDRKSLNGLVTIVGKAGDINCSLICARAFQKFDCDLAILCGIAAGVKLEISKYSTIIANNIVDYEYQRLNEDGITYRPSVYSVDNYNEKRISSIILESNNWVQYFLKNTNTIFNNDSKYFKKFIPALTLKDGEIASGAKLFADGKTLQHIKDNIPIGKGIIAADMEGGGFCPTCKEYKRDWLVFRGISDYGEADKNSKSNKMYQSIAAASAATAMLYYLKKLYRIPEERGDGEIELLF